MDINQRLIQFLGTKEVYSSESNFLRALYQVFCDKEDMEFAVLLSTPAKKSKSSQIRLVQTIHGDFEDSDREHYFEQLNLLEKMKQNAIMCETNWICFSTGTYSRQKYFYLIKVKDECSWTNKELKAVVKPIRGIYSQFSRIRACEIRNSLIYIDDVTGLFNQRKLHLDLEARFKEHQYSGEGFAVLFIDIDHFKDVNDCHGHLIGTQLLFELGNLLRMILRESDLIYRYGGDEFVMLIPNVTDDIGRKVGNRILKAVKTHKFKVREGNIFKLSVSIGVAEFPRDASSKDEILEMADKMMYEAKKSGRGRVCMTAEFYSE